MIRPVTSLVLTLLLAGCTVGPDYTRPPPATAPPPTTPHHANAAERSEQ